MDLSRHPCFNDAVRHEFGRIHLPVAPTCNVQCNFCDRRFDCLNESRPGVTSVVLSPARALRYLQESLQHDPRITVVGIAGPGDPFADPEPTLETLRLVRREHPGMLLCVASNGLNVPPHMDELAELKVSHVTVTVNSVEPAIGERIYAWIRDDRRPFRGRVAANILLERQMQAIRGLKARGVMVKINSILVPGINDHHIAEIARAVSEAGADVFNCIALYPVEGTPFAQIAEPSADAVATARREAEAFLPQMHHCTRCRADAAGLLGETLAEERISALANAASGPEIDQAQRPYVAVATMEGMLVNLHLGEAASVAIYGPSDEGYQWIESRSAPAPGGGAERWEKLAATLTDCRAVLVSSAGRQPCKVLSDRGVPVVMMEGLIEEGLDAVYAGQELRAPLRSSHRCGAGAACAGDGMGCG
jgi:nitrogen fixation protein NifB